ncbi:MAG TPA: ankyrin repeat domain-containing protein [Pyrinomonadaceae bacterium]
MKVIPQFLLPFILLFTSVVTLSQVPKQELNDQFWEAVRKGDLAAVTSLLDQGADVNAKFRYGTTALFKAAERGHIEIVKLLLARGADVTVKDTFYGATAMTWALDSNHVDVVTALLQKDPRSASEVLMTGVREGKPSLVKIALASGALKAETLTPALVIATDDKDKIEIAEMLKKAGALPPPEVEAAKLQSYVGRYKDEAGTEVAITLTNGRLSAAPTGQRPFALIPIDDTNFRPLAFDGTLVHFNLDADNPTGLELKRGQITTQLKRVVETKQP